MDSKRYVELPDPRSIGWLNTALLATLTVGISLVHSLDFHRPFSTPKQILLDLSLALAALCIYRHRDHLRFPSVGRHTAALIIIFATVSLICASFYWAYPWATILGYSRIVLLTVFFYALIQNSPDALREICRWIGLAGIITVAIYMAQVLSPEFARSVYARGHPAAFIGNTNMLAEFLGIVICALLYLAFRRPSLYLEALIALHLWALYSLNCRSIYIWLGISTCLFIVWSLRHNRRILIKLARVLLAVLTIEATMSVAIDWREEANPAQSSSHKLHRQKNLMQSTMQIRLQLWQDSLDLIAANPLGIGASTFKHYQNEIAKEKEHENFDEFEVFRGPHNEILRITAELGIAPAMILAILLALLIWPYLRSIPISTPGTEQTFAGFLLLLFALQGLAQFPGELAFPTVALSLLLALLLAHRERQTSWKDLAVWQRESIVLAGILISLLAILSASSHLMSGQLRAASTPLYIACRIYPDNEDACVDAAQTMLDARQSEHALALLTNMDVRVQGKSQRVRLSLAHAYWQNGRIDEACRRFEEYDRFFNNQSSIHKRFMENCR